MYDNEQQLITNKLIKQHIYSSLINVLALNSTANVMQHFGFAHL